MTYDRELHHRQSIRWQEHDYAASGTYFVTICTADRACLFGDVLDSETRVNALGRIVEDEWVRTGVVRPEVVIDVFVVMPNHLHGFVTLRPDESRQDPGANMAQGDAALRRPPRSLGSMIAAFKQVTTVRINEVRGTPGASIWQRGYHDRVVRDGDEFDRIAEYIVTNPDRWEHDGLFPL